MPGFDNNLVNKLPAVVTLKYEGCRKEGEDKDQFLCSLLDRLGLARKEDTELGRMINIIEDPLVLSVSLRLHVDVFNLPGNKKYITQKNLFI